MVDATGIWALLMAAVFVVLALVALAVLADRPREPRPDLARLRTEAEELAAHADAVQVAAATAADAATGKRARVAAVECVRDEAWAAQEEADRAYREASRAVQEGRAVIKAARAAAAAEAGQGWPGQDGAEQTRPEPDGADGAEQTRPEPDGAEQTRPEPDGAEQDRERVIARAALSAYRRGDISVDELREVFRRAGDWDPAQDELERTADRRRAERAAARRAYDRAAAEVRRVDQAARVAEIRAQALLDEATESATEAQEALLAVQRHSRRRSRRRR